MIIKGIELSPKRTGTLKKHNFENLTYLKIFLIWYRLKGGIEYNE